MVVDNILDHTTLPVGTVEGAASPLSDTSGEPAEL